MPAVGRVIEEIKNAVGTCGFASPPEADLRLGITADGRYCDVTESVILSGRYRGVTVPV